MLRVIAVFFVVGLSHVLFGMELQKKDTITIKTCYDNKEFELKKRHIGHSRVLQVLHIHQKRKEDNVIIIPKAICEHENVSNTDLTLFSEACEKKEEINYFADLSREKRLGHFRAAGVLSASVLLANYMDCFFDKAMGVNHINPHLVDGRVVSYYMNGVIQQQGELQGQQFTDMKLSVFHDGSYYLAPNVLHQYGKCSVSGHNAFRNTFSVGQFMFVVNAMSPGGYPCTITNTGDNDRVRLWKTDLTSVDIVGCEGEVTHSVFANNGGCLITGSQSGNHNLLCTKISSEGSLISQWMVGHKNPIEEIIVSFDSNKIVTVAEGEKTVTLWRGNGLFLCNLGDFFADSKKVIAFSSDSNRLIVCAGNKICLWDISSAPQCTLINTITIADKSCNFCMVKYLDKVNRIVVGRTDGKIHLFNGCSEMVLDGHQPFPISAIVGDNYGNTIVSATNNINDCLIVWDGITGKCLKKLVGHPEVSFLQMSPDAQYVVSTSFGYSSLWNLYPSGAYQEPKKITDIITVSQAHFIYRLYASIINHTIVSLSEQEKSAFVESLPVEPVDVKNFVKICFADILSQKNQHERK